MIPHLRTGTRAVAAVVLCAVLYQPAAALAAPTAAALANERGCMACHGLVRKQVGPGFAQVAQRYRGDPTAALRLAAKVRAGSVGNWGRVIMPAQPQVSEPESTVLSAWVLSQPAPP